MRMNFVLNGLLLALSCGAVYFVRMQSARASRSDAATSRTASARMTPVSYPDASTERVLAAYDAGRESGKAAGSIGEFLSGIQPYPGKPDIYSHANTMGVFDSMLAKIREGGMPALKLVEECEKNRGILRTNPQFYDLISDAYLAAAHGDHGQLITALWEKGERVVHRNEFLAMKSAYENSDDSHTCILAAVMSEIDDVNPAKISGAIDELGRNQLGPRWHDLPWWAKEALLRAFGPTLGNADTVRGLAARMDRNWKWKLYRAAVGGKKDSGFTDEIFKECCARWDWRMQVNEMIPVFEAQALKSPEKALAWLRAQPGGSSMEEELWKRLQFAGASLGDANLTKTALDELRSRYRTSGLDSLPGELPVAAQVAVLNNMEQEELTRQLMKPERFSPERLQMIAENADAAPETLAAALLALRLRNPLIGAGTADDIRMLVRENAETYHRNLFVALVPITEANPKAALELVFDFPPEFLTATNNVEMVAGITYRRLGAEGVGALTDAAEANPRFADQLLAGYLRPWAKDSPDAVVEWALAQDASNPIMQKALDAAARAMVTTSPERAAEFSGLLENQETRKLIEAEYQSSLQRPHEVK